MSPVPYNPQPSRKVAEAAALDAQSLSRHGAALRALARGILGDEHAAEDAVQDAWLQALGGPEAQGRTTLGERLGGLVARFARDARRAKRTQAERERRHIRDRAHDESRAAIGRSVEMAEVVAHALSSLPHDWREVLWLRFYEDLGPGAIAERLQLPLETVRSRLRRGLTALRGLVQARLEQSGSNLQALAPLAFAGRGLTAATLTALPPTAVGAGSLIIIMKKLVIVAVAALVVSGTIWLTDRRVDSDVPHEFSTVVAQARGDTNISGVTDPTVVPVSDHVRTQAGPAESAAPARVPSQVPVSWPASTITVIDERTRTAVPFLEIMAQSGALERRLTTDIEGRITLPVGYGPIVVFSWEAEEATAAQAARAAANEAAKLESVPAVTQVISASAVSIGDDVFLGAGRARPTQRDVWDRAAGDAGSERDLVVALGPTWILAPMHSGPSTLSGGGAADDLEASLFASLRRRGGGGWTIGATVERTDSTLWTRFGPSEAHQLGEGGTLMLELRSEDGFWLGAAPVDRHAGFDPTPLGVTLKSCAAIRGRVIDGAGQPIARQEIGFQYEGAERTRTTTTGANGEYRVRWLRPVGVTAFVADESFEPFEQTLNLRPAVDHELNITLEVRPGGGTISGVIESATGSFSGRVFLHINGVDGTSYWARADPKLRDEDGVRRAEFSFKGLPAGRYRVSCNTPEPYAIAAAVRLVEPPDESLRFVVEDDQPPRRIEVQAFEGAVTESMEFVFRYAVDGGYTRTAKASGMAALEIEVPRGSSVTWTVFAPGFLPVSGDERAFVGEQLRVAMKPGWGASVLLLGIETLSRLADVEVFADGVVVGRTNAQGELVVSLAREPTRIHFNETKWLVHLSGTYRSQLDPETGALLERRDVTSIAAYLRPVR